jgi:hypothetical protein
MNEIYKTLTKDSLNLYIKRLFFKGRKGNVIDNLGGLKNDIKKKDNARFIGTHPNCPVISMWK